MMTDPAILFVKPGAISARDKKTLQKAGVLIIEIENPADAKFTRAHAELSSTEMLLAAAKAIYQSNMALPRELFGKMICEAITAKAGKAG